MKVKASSKHLFYGLPRAVAAIYKGKNLFWQFLAIVLTYIIVATGFDWTYFKATRPVPFSILLPAIALGALLPVIVPLFLLALGYARKSVRLVNTGWAVGQAALLGFLVSTFYKIFTGRMPPPHDIINNVSANFRFGFLRGGVFWGWPSSHTTVAFAMSAALFAMYPGKDATSRTIRWLAALWAVYVGLGVSMSIHWFSEFVAGAILGAIIGTAVGTNFHHQGYNT
ncbi:MAG: phosphatase PAP2 family protein [Patescibacteria group bacterium]|nr:phosphatase PAP2 family protein [Patescibacteria group bacterium]MDE2116282.1 phosphatase PAP2 family protein [Patescibacteria group bacterium]